MTSDAEINTLGNDKIDPGRCPLCGELNACFNAECESKDNNCWCNDPNISFPEALLDKVPEEVRRKACICRKCVEDFMAKQV